MKLDPAVAHFEYAAKTRPPDYYDDLLAFMPEQAARVFDAGCGSGRVALRVGALAKFVVGIDISPQAIELARGRQAEHTQGNVVWVVGDVQRPPFQSECFDFVVSTNVLRFTDPQVSLVGLSCLVKPAGRMAVKDIIISPRRWRIRPLWYLYATLRSALVYVGAYDLGTSLRFIAYRFSRTGLRQEFRQHRLTSATFKEVFSRSLPGCSFKTGKHDSIAFWIRPQDKALRSPAALDETQQRQPGQV